MNSKLISTGIGIILVGIALIVGVIWFTCRIYVPEDMCAVLIHKTGDPVPADQMGVATEPGQKGILMDVLGPGRHFFYDPIRWDHQLVSLTEIPSGDPSTWEWVPSLDDDQRSQFRQDAFRFKGKFPQIGVVTRKIGAEPPAGRDVVDRASGYKGVLREVLTPGTYKINPYVYEVELHPAVVIPAGFVGVVTNLYGKPPVEDSAVTPDLVIPTGTTEEDESGGDDTAPRMRSLAKPGQRGVLPDVLQPGVYFINPRLQKVTLVEIGFNEFSQVKISEAENLRIEFPSDTGFRIRVGVTVVWGVHPRHAAEIIDEFGNIDRVLDKVIGPQLRSICRNIGSTYAARDFIQGEKRLLFQQDMTAELQRVCREKHIEILLALVREIEVHAPSATAGAGEVTEDLKRTIQESFIARESQITKEKQREAEAVKAQLEEERKKIEIMRETILAESRVMVVDIQTDAIKEGAEIEAEGQLGVARIQEEVAKLDARRTEILGQANADVEKMAKQAEAEGYRMLVDAFGSPQAFNLYTFADNFEPESIRLFFAGDGTFWTDLSRFEEAGAAQLLQQRVSPEK
jgi:hypothetical protein